VLATRGVGLAPLAALLARPQATPAVPPGEWRQF
ncbi:MAG: hypothetical protein JWP22_2901, partial [Ramlibacter sp.]|nr:hypothetical protein [Ramlibacter sp.]